MVVFDTEVFSHFWCFISYDTKTKDFTIIKNNREELLAFYEKNKTEVWCGYNVSGYDSYIINAILSGQNPKGINDFIISGNLGFKYYNYSLYYPIVYVDLKTSKADPSLKKLEGMMGESIEECSIPFTLDRPLTEREIEEVIKYCKHDVEQTVLVLQHKKKDVIVKYELCEKYGIGLQGLKLTNAQLAGVILEASKTPRKVDNKFDFDLSTALNIIDVDKNKDIINFFETCLKDAKQGVDVSGYSTLIKVGNIEVKIGWGGAHGVIENSVFNKSLQLIDATAYYPSILTQYNMLSDLKGFNKYISAYLENLHLKKIKSNKRGALKLFLNSVTGALRANFNGLYNPVVGNKLCCLGQLFLIDLCRMIENKVDFYNINTDGIIVHIKEDVSAELAEWQKKTNLLLDVTNCRKLAQWNTNNYILIQDDGKIKSIGAYRIPTPLIYNNAIAVEAVIAYLRDGVPIEETINSCNELYKFQLIVRNRGFAFYQGNKEYPLKYLRVFASKDKSHEPIVSMGYSKLGSKQVQVYNLLPNNCFIDNSRVVDKTTPEYLDREWYIKSAHALLNNFK